MCIPSLPFSHHTPSREFVMKKSNFSQHTGPVLTYSSCELAVPSRGKREQETLLLHLCGDTNPPAQSPGADPAGSAGSFGSPGAGRWSSGTELTTLAELCSVCAVPHPPTRGYSAGFTRRWNRACWGFFYFIFFPRSRGSGCDCDAQGRAWASHSPLPQQHTQTYLSSALH